MTIKICLSWRLKRWRQENVRNKMKWNCTRYTLILQGRNRLTMVVRRSPRRFLKISAQVFKDFFESVRNIPPRCARRFSPWRFSKGAPTFQPAALLSVFGGAAQNFAKRQLCVTFSRNFLLFPSDSVLQTNNGLLSFVK